MTTPPSRHRKRWTAQERATMHELYPSHRTEDILHLFPGRNLSAVRQAAQRMGLQKTPELLARLRFHEGQTPWNKGKAGATGNHPNCRAHWFKPGRSPQEARNYVPIGSLRISKNGILQRKVTDDLAIAPQQRWQSVHSLVWERHHGPVPEGHIIVFRPGQATTDPARITPDKLECISRAENLRRNSVHRHPRELVELYRLKASITRRVNHIRRKEANQ